MSLRDHSGPSRRQVLAGLGALAVGCGGRSAPPLPGEILGASDVTRGHRLREPFTPPTAGPAEPVDVAIVGAGIAGLSAAWRLHQAGFAGRVALLDLGDAPGGTARAGNGEAGPFALGAHYITLPNAEATHLHALLADLGVITGFDGERRPIFDPTMLCHAPEERLFVGGAWVEGLWPEALASDEDRAQLAAFVALVADWRARRGADGLPAFTIPLARCSRDPEIRALARLSFDEWLDRQGLTAPRLRWWLQYATRDDYGCGLAACSAWAGLHYHCARDPRPGDARDLDTHVLTWPGGNGWLVEQLTARVPWPVTPRAIVRAVELDADGARLHVDQDGQLRQIRAAVAILAVPGYVTDRLMPRDLPGPRPEHAPWRVAAIQVDRPPLSHGVKAAWDSVLYEGEGLGYVWSAHQTGRPDGPGVLSWYEAMWRDPPASARAALLAAPWEAEVERVMSELAPAHPDLRARVQRLDVVKWGHGTAIPAIGLHADPADLEARARPRGPVLFAHTDLSGMSLFEEASWHGVRAAEEALALLGRPIERSLVTPG